MVKVLTTPVVVVLLARRSTSPRLGCPALRPPLEGRVTYTLEGFVSKENSTTYAGGTSILGLLGVAFVVLKLCGVITWSWWWVTAPFWLVPAVIIVLMVVGILILKLIR